MKSSPGLAGAPVPEDRRRSSGVSTGQRSGPSALHLPVVVTTGCPAGVGPEIALRALRSAASGPAIIVGDRGSLERAAGLVGWSVRRVAALPSYVPGEPLPGRLSIFQPGPPLAASDCAPGHPTPAGGVAQLGFIEAGFKLAQARAWPLVTGPVSKEVIAKSGLSRAKKFLGHTEWLEAMDGAPHSVMCFTSQKLTTALVTTHVPLAKVTKLLSAELVRRAVIELADLLLRLRPDVRPLQIAVCSFNPHAGEGQLLGTEETRAIVPGVILAQAALGRKVRVLGPLGAETAYRKGAAGQFDGVVGIYHDQATIPMKLLDFGGAVNVTQGLSVVRTSVDHGTAYDIAGKGLASSRGMKSAIEMARTLGAVGRRLPLGVR